MKYSNKGSSNSVWLPLLWLLIVPVINVFYNILNHPGVHVYSLETSLDLKIPFVASFIIPYLLWYPFITAVLIALAFKDRQIYFQTLIAQCSGLIISYVFFALFQTGIQRPDVHSEPDFIYKVVNFVYSNDQQYNCFPSIHVLTSYLMLRGTRIFGQKIWLMITAMSILIIVSTVLVKQHVLADIGGGILVAELCYRLSGTVISFVQKKQQRSRK
ncbi:serine/threonine protein phosphatase [Paenibacillus sp. P3E]|uniref:phosphatase PAP2 family protein n=1 Tax=Paenibacillus sp. P3E TaxID=1349435 RepID=UPI000939BC98|nr:phosphatase PAP2 family protein [Paenibacillus sp. P3E]OKP90272.1 serine/threonine protein phosphatase [Paenibacillus sp. P3E]